VTITKEKTKSKENIYSLPVSFLSLSEGTGTILANSVVELQLGTSSTRENFVY